MTQILYDFEFPVGVFWVLKDFLYCEFSASVFIKDFEYLSECSFSYRFQPGVVFRFVTLVLARNETLALVLGYLQSVCLTCFPLGVAEICIEIFLHFLKIINYIFL